MERAWTPTDPVLLSTGIAGTPPGSAVLIDALQFSAIDIVDPNPDLILAGGELMRDIDALVSGGRPIRGAAADGATEVLLRVPVPGPGIVVFSLRGAGAPADGTLRTRLGSEHASTIVSDIVLSSQGGAYGLARYTAPADFDRGGDGALGERTIQLTATYLADTGAGFTSQIDFQITRPPVVLAHGLWSGITEWFDLPISQDPRFVITYADHAYSCDQELRVVPQQPLRCPLQRTGPPDGLLLCGLAPANPIDAAMRDALANLRRQGVATTQVDVVAHGAAGIYARQHIDAPSYRNRSNLNQGDVNRLITLNTPHRGSAVANLIAVARDAPTGPLPSDVFLCRARLSGATPVEPGDIDAVTTSRVSLGHAAVPGHAIVGAGGSALTLALATRKLADKALLYTLVRQNQPVPIFGPGSVFGASDHDLFATVESQMGGLPNTAVTSFQMSPTPQQGDSDQFHSLRFPPVSARIVELLNSPVDGPLFDVFPDSP